ncbi:MAG TPA: hypothetical protein V6D20_01225, partial [Candidatus Obscuribacterales bacterium]
MGRGLVSAIAQNSARGVLLNGAVINAGTGNISITGTGEGLGSDNRGVEIINGATIQADGNGAIEITGTGGKANSGTLSANLGVFIADSSVQVADGNLTLIGTGGSDGSRNRGIRVGGNATVKAIGTGSIALIGTGGDGTGLNSGIDLEDSIIESVTGAIALTGTGGNGNSSRGIYMTNGAEIRSQDGAISLVGNGAATATGIDNIGVDIRNSTINATGFGSMTFSGTGGSDTSRNDGIYFRTSQITGNNGDLEFIGTGSSSATGDNNRGIVVFDGSTIQATGSGNITLQGTGGTGVNDNLGVLILSTNTAIASTTGEIRITGQGSTTATGTNNGGISLSQGNITSASGAISLTGTAQPNSGTIRNYGILLDANAAVRSID